MDIATLIGLIGAMGVVGGAIALGGDFGAFIDIPSIVVVVGGTSMAVMASHTLGQFFGSFKISEKIDNIFTINSYMSTILSSVFYTGLLFLLPVVVYLFTRLGILTAAYLRKYRKHSIVGVLILSAVITPPNLISQVIVGVPIMLLYEVGILVSARVEKKLKNQEVKGA